MNLQKKEQKLHRNFFMGIFLKEWGNSEALFNFLHMHNCKKLQEIPVDIAISLTWF